MAVNPAFADQKRALWREWGKPFCIGKICHEGAQIAVIDTYQARFEPGSAFHFGLVMHFNQHVHAAFDRCGFNFRHRAIFKRGDDNQDCIRANAARFGNLPRVDHEILAQYRQVTGCPRCLQIILVSLKIGCIGENRETGSASGLIGFGMIGGLEIGTDQAF